MFDPKLSAEAVVRQRLADAERRRLARAVRRHRLTERRRKLIDGL